MPCCRLTLPVAILVVAGLAGFTSRAAAVSQPLDARAGVAVERDVTPAAVDGLTLLGDLDHALPAYADALAIFRRIRDRDGEAAALTGLVFSKYELGRLQDARAHAGSAVRVIESFQADVADPEVRASYVSRNRAAFSLYIDVEMALEESKPGRGHAAAALVASEGARARGLVDLLADARSRIDAGVNRELGNV
jgi:tetratricopeptide (TPR) repeat protein